MDSVLLLLLHVPVERQSERQDEVFILSWSCSLE